jgi:hypothetical protein
VGVGLTCSKEPDLDLLEVQQLDELVDGLRHLRSIGDCPSRGTTPLNRDRPVLTRGP